MAPNSPGPGVDASGRPVSDPTNNVLDLVRAESRRQDDLREAETRHQEAMASIRAEHAKELRAAETERINAIRAVDVAAVEAAAIVQRTQADALAKTVIDTAAAQATSLRAEIAPIQESIASLRQSQYEGAGAKGQVADSQAKSGGVGLWVGLAVAVAFGLSSAIISGAALIYAVTR